MTVTVRKATVEDLQRILELNRKLFEKEKKDYDPTLNLDWPFSDEGKSEFSTKISFPDFCVLIAVVNNKIIGYLCADLITNGYYRTLPLVASLDSMFVESKFQSQGVGSALYDEFLKWCRTKNVKKLRAEASAQNSQAIGFYKKKGFKKFSTTLEHDI